MAEARREAQRAVQDGRSRVFIEGIAPVLEAGAYAVKRVLGDTLTVSVDLIADGHDVVAGELLMSRPSAERTATGQAIARPIHLRQRLAPLPNDRYAASIELDQLGLWHFTVEAWIDHFATWRRNLERKLDAAQDIEVELLVGAGLVRAALRSAEAPSATPRTDAALLAQAAAGLDDRSAPAPARARLALAEDRARSMARHAARSHGSRHSTWLPVWVDREKARFSSWYEMFPRSTGKDRHGTFETSLVMLPYVADMGFDVLYLPPIHPIGHTFRKGKNNAPSADEGDVGSPWAIGAAEGGHKSVHPELGTLADFDRFAREAARHGLELALDVALQVTPDHPYVKEHPEWFKRRPDGTIQYAENPPKKYQDIYPFDFESEQWWSLWLELKSVFDFWIERGVRIFRVDNPHTKSLAFWQWCIAELTREHPDLIFLAEAFTRPKLMYLLAKLGFTQSYTYFTWRHTAQELRAYLRELTSAPANEFFRPNFWPNTPDILPEHLQHAGRAAFSLRLVLAATLSSNYGIYGPAYELCENVPRAGAEEYADNEKYELKSWTPTSDTSLRPLIKRINAIRRDNPALQQMSLSFHETDNDLLLAFSKHSAAGDSSVLVVINMDANHAQSGWVHLDVPKLAPDGAETTPRDVQLHDLISDARYFSEGRRLFVRLDPASAPAHIFRLRRRQRSEHDFDYFM